MAAAAVVTDMVADMAMMITTVTMAAPVVDMMTTVAMKNTISIPRCRTAWQHRGAEAAVVE